MGEEVNGGGSKLTGGYRTNFLDSPASEGSQDTTVMYGGKVLSSGKPLDSMSIEEVRGELREIESPESALFTGDLNQWDRQKVIKRRMDLRKRIAGPEGNRPYNSMEETLKKQGVTKESLQRDQEKFQDRSDQSEEEKTLSALTTYFGGEKERDTAIKAAQGLVKKYGSQDDLDFLDRSGMGNSPELIKKLGEIAKILEDGRKKKRR